MKQPKVIERFTDNGEHSHWELINVDTGDTLWKELDPDDEMIIIEGSEFRRGDIYDIYECERDKRMFLNREAGFIVQTIGRKGVEANQIKFYERIPYESYPRDIAQKKELWDGRMKSAICKWKNI